MTDAEYQKARAAVLAGGDPPAVLLAECKRSVRLLVRTSGLPEHYSPYGIWSDEAIEEVFADWIAVRLVDRGQLRAMLQRAPLLRVFRRMAETSVRQHLIDRLKRSQAANLYERVVQLLTRRAFAAQGTGAGRLCHLVDGPTDPFDGDDQQLLSLAWSLGNFEVIRYDLAARKLSPLLSAADLDRFVTGMLAAGSMSVATIVRALRLRFNLDDREPATLDTETGPVGDDPADSSGLIEDLVTATLAELSYRQGRVLIGLEDGKSGRELADELGCSTGTISHEKARIAEVLARLGTDAPAVLKNVLDALFQANT